MNFSPVSATFLTRRALRRSGRRVLWVLGFLLAATAPASARDWLVPQQAPTIQAAVDSCVQGDVVVVDAGTYTDCTTLSEGVYHIAVLESGVSLRGATGDPADVILDAQGAGRCLEMRSLDGTIEVEAVTLRGGRALNPFGSGGAVFVYDTEPVFRSCVFDSNYADFAGGAMAVLYGGVTIEDCVFLGNESASIGGALRLSSSPTMIIGSTFHGTLGQTLHYRTEAPVLERCLITGGTGAAIVRNSDTDPLPDITCSDLWGNEEDWSDFFADLADSNGNLEADPQYCNPLFGDLTLYVSSPCSEENSPCGRIGALPSACGTGSNVLLVRADGSGAYPTIQAAINAAAAGDTVALADGTYTGEGNRNLDFLGKPIVVMGRSGDPDRAIIDCGGSAGDPQRGFHFHGGETGFSVLRDVTITNADVSGDGAGILCESSPRIENCVLRLNHAARGAGLYCDGGSPEVVDCLFHRNEGRQQGGGAAFFGSGAILRGCTFSENWGAQGSAVFLPDSSSVTIETSTLAYNNCALDKAMVGVDGHSSLTLERTIIAFGNQHAVREFDQGEILIAESNVYGNAAGDWSLAIIAQRGDEGNISADPRFCDGEAGDLGLRSDSPCTEFNAWLGRRMGAHGTGCDAPAVFADASTALGGGAALAGQGASWSDIDGDGDLDASIANLWAANEIYLGDGSGGFAPLDNTALQFVGPTESMLWADRDNDGDLDVYLTNDGLPNLLIEAENGEYVMTWIDGLNPDGPAGGSAWLDYDGDGHLDLLVAATDTISAMMHADGQGGYAGDAGFAALGIGEIQQAVPGDWDDDGDPDLYLVHDGEVNRLVTWDGQFEFVTIGDAGDNGAGRSAAWGDYDGDGDLDLYLVNAGGPNRLLENRGGTSFFEATEGAARDEGPGRSGAWADWDNDGDLDLLVTNCGGPDRLLRNEGDDLFVNVFDPAFAEADSSAGAAWGDYDGDGDLDLLIARRSGATRLLRNEQATGNHWFELDLVHASGRPGCRGARVRVVTGDKVQIREVGASGGWLSQDALTVHFGLGAATVIDTLEVTLQGSTWPVLTGVAADQRMTLVSGGASPVAPDDDVPPGADRPGFHACYPNPFNPTTTIRFALSEPGPASLTVYDVAGRRVRTLFDEPRRAGLQQVVWAGRDESGRRVASGVYYLRLQSASVEQVRSVVLVK